jgi:hypothetical protein
MRQCAASHWDCALQSAHPPIDPSFMEPHTRHPSFSLFLLNDGSQNKTKTKPLFVLAKLACNLLLRMSLSNHTSV